MPKPRGKEHSSLTETAGTVVRELKKLPGIKMIAPGEIRRNSPSSQGTFITATYTTAGFELLISGQSSQRVAVHTTDDPAIVFTQLRGRKRLQDFVFKTRERKPGV